MRIPSGKVDQVIFFVAFDSNDNLTRKTGLSAFTVYRSRKGGTATVYTTPTIAELSSANMPGVYSLLIDEDTTIDSASDSEEYAVHITATGMAPVTRTLELYRRDTTSGRTLAVDSSSRADASVGAMAANVMTAAAAASDLTTELQGGLATAAALATADGKLDAIGASTTNLPSDPADASVIALATDAILTAIATRLAAAGYTAPDNAAIANIQSRLPAALIFGRMNSNVGSVNGVAVAGDGAATPWGP